TGLERLLEPVYAPIRRILPNMGGLDLSPLVVLIGIYAIRIIIINNAPALIHGICTGAGRADIRRRSGHRSRLRPSDPWRAMRRHHAGPRARGSCGAVLPAYVAVQHHESLEKEDRGASHPGVETAWLTGARPVTRNGLGPGLRSGGLRRGLPRR